LLWLGFSLSSHLDLPWLDVLNDKHMPDCKTFTAIENKVEQGDWWVSKLGSHWSLLAFERNANIFVHHDSNRGMNKVLLEDKSPHNSSRFHDSQQLNPWLQVDTQQQLFSSIHADSRPQEILLSLQQLVHLGVRFFEIRIQFLFVARI